MLQRLSILPLSPRSGSLSGLIERFGQWWLKEFLDLFPRRVADWLVGRSCNVLILATEQDCVSMQLLGGSRQKRASTRVSIPSYSSSAIDDFLKSHGLRRKDVDIGVRLPPEQFFDRSMILPLEAAGSLGDVVTQDLARKTPFRLEEIHHDFAANRVSGQNKISVRQWIIRRVFVSDAAASLQLTLDDVAFIEGTAEITDNAPRPLVTLRRGRDGRSSRLHKATLALTVSAALLAAAAAASTYWRQQVLIDDLAVQIAAARSKAQHVRSGLDKLQQEQKTLLGLRSRRMKVPTLLDIWDEATRVLPTHSWLTELRVAEIPQKQEQQLTMIGFSAAASSLVGLIVGSTMFSDASLTAPIAIDPVESRERFVLQANVKRSKRGNVP